MNELNEWWPKEYTWSQDKLKEIRINGQKDGLCTEIGPYGFRCDWGRVTELTENEKIKLKWQIRATGTIRLYLKILFIKALVHLIKTYFGSALRKIFSLKPTK